jgi:glycosyltransferase involved in cell wall biosynthesis
MVQEEKGHLKQSVSVVIPVYNEHRTIGTLVDQVRKTGIPDEIIIVDDGSTDGTREWLLEHFGPDFTEGVSRQDSVCESSLDSPRIRVLIHQHNQGKGAALKTGFIHVRGDLVIVQDADLEYSPEDYPRLLAPLLEDEADVVYGSRFLGECEGRWPLDSYWGNKMFTGLINAVTRLSLTDVWTGYKVFRKTVLESVSLVESRFEMELELTIKVAQQKWRVAEVPISYRPRSKAEGKKIRWRDGIQSIKTLCRYRKVS